MVGLKWCVSGSWESTIWPVLSDEQKNNGNHVPLFPLLNDEQHEQQGAGGSVRTSHPLIFVTFAGSCPLKLQVF